MHSHRRGPGPAKEDIEHFVRHTIGRRLRAGMAGAFAFGGEGLRFGGGYAAHRDLHLALLSFPTRRPPDLFAVQAASSRQSR